MRLSPFTSDFKAYCKQNHIVRYKLSQQADISAEVLERLNKNQPISQKSYNKLINHLDKDLFNLANEDRKLAQNTLRHHHRVLNAILQKAVKWGYMDENPCSKVEPPREERKEAAYLDDIQIQSLLGLLENEPEQYRMMIQLFIFSGMRRGDEYVKQKAKFFDTQEYHNSQPHLRLAIISITFRLSLTFLWIRPSACARISIHP